MKKIFFLLFLAIMLSACQTNVKTVDFSTSDHGTVDVNNHGDRFDNNLNMKTDVEMYNEHEDNKYIPDCYTMCNEIILDTCMDEIIEFEYKDIWYGDSIMDAEYCESICESIPDDAKECIAKAKECDSIRSSAPYCIDEDPEIPTEEPDAKAENYDCSTVCYKYKECAMLSPEATTQDGNEAYNSCYQECQNWSEETISCMRNTSTGTAMGCMRLSQCGVQEYIK